VLDFIHYCDVAEALAKEKTAGTTEWGWTRQLRYYHRAEGSVKVRDERPKYGTGPLVAAAVVT
jgi:hypothetical protein